MPPSRLMHLAHEPRLSFPAAVTKDPSSSAFPSQSLFWALGGFPSSTGVPVSPLTANQVATVYGCVKSRSEDLGKTELFLRRETSAGWVRDYEHPIARLLVRPNAWMTPFTFRRYIEQSVCLRGNAYVVILRGDAGEPRELVPVSPDACSPPMVSADGTLFYNVTHPRVGQSKLLHEDNVLHIRNIGMDGGYTGMSPISAAQEAIGLAAAAQQHGAVLFRQGAQINGVLKHEKTLSREAKDYISASFSAKFAGVQNAHKIPVLEEGMTYEKIGMTAEESQFLETRQFQRGEICAIFRVPPHKIMDLSRSTFNNMEIAEQAYINDALMPDADQIAQESEHKLLFEDERGRYSLSWDWDTLLRADRKTRYDAHAVALNNGFASVNQVRRMEGWAGIGPEGDTFNRPLNLGPVGTKPPATNTPGDMSPNPVPSSEQENDA
jgi:HK97 family phage portal protein